jgi:hypothetical protein
MGAGALRIVRPNLRRQVVEHRSICVGAITVSQWQTFSQLAHVAGPVEGFQSPPAQHRAMPLRLATQICVCALLQEVRASSGATSSRPLAQRVASRSRITLQCGATGPRGTSP